jgi:hypothetical protein
MHSRPHTTLVLCTALLLPASLHAGRACVAPEEAASHSNKDICVAAHVYNVVDLADGTRIIDVCSPKTADADCRFTIVSLKTDRKDIGDLKHWLDQDIRIRGIVRPVNGRSEIFLSHVRQFHGGSEKFRPNPELMKGFAAGDSKPPVSDPAFKTRSSHGSSSSN